MRKRILALMLVLLTTNLAACSDTVNVPSKEEIEDSNSLIKIGFSQVGAESDYRTANTASMRETFTTEKGYDLTFDDAQGKQDKQIEAIRKYIQQQVDYIVVAPIGETGWDIVLEEVKAANIPLIIVDRMIDVSEDLYTAWVGSNFELEAKKATQWLKQYLKVQGKETAKIAHIQGTIGSSAQIGRTKGLEAAVAENGWEILGQQDGAFEQAKGQEVMESMLEQSGDEIDVVYCENDNEALGAIAAIEGAGKKVGPNGDIIVMSFDTTTMGLTEMLSGRIMCNAECNPLHGPRVEEIIKQLEAGKTPEKTQYVDEEIFAYGTDVETIAVDGTEYPVTSITQKIIKERPY